MKRKAVVILPKLNDCKGDMSPKSKWFIYYTVRNPKNDKMERHRVFTGFAKLKTKKARYEHAQQLIEEYVLKLKTGWTPYEEQTVIYEDEIEYHNAAKVFGRKRRSNLTIRKYMSDFLQVQKKRLKPKSYESYVGKIRVFAQFLESRGLGENDLSTIDEKVIKTFFDYLITERRLAKRTIEKYGHTIRIFFDSLKDKIKENPVKEIPSLPDNVDKGARTISKYDIEAFKRHIKSRDPQLWLAIQFEFYCFIRPGTELRLMKIGWLDLGAGTVRIPKNFSKNGKSEVVVIPSQFLDILVKEYNLNLYDNELYVFSQFGKPGKEPLGKNTLRNRFNRLRDELGLSKDYKFYSWKHTGAVSASRAGMPIKDLQLQLRHTSLETTDIYLRRMKGIDSDALRERFPSM